MTKQAAPFKYILLVVSLMLIGVGGIAYDKLASTHPDESGVATAAPLATAGVVVKAAPAATPDASATILPTQANFVSLPILPDGITFSPDAEAHMVSGYGSPAGQGEVVVDRPGKDVVLILATHESTLWTVRNTAAKSLTVIASGYDPPYMEAIGAMDAYQVNQGEFGYARSLMDNNFIRVMAAINRRIQIARLSSFTGVSLRRGTIDNVVINKVIDSDKLDTGWPYPEEGPNATFVLNTPFGPKEWTPQGPKGHGILTASFPAYTGSELKDVSLDKTSLSIMENGTTKWYPLPPNFPKFSWAKGMAVDTDDDILCIVSFGGEGFFYRFDLKGRKWLDAKSMNNVDVDQLVYDRWGKVFYGSEMMSQNSILVMDKTGRTVSMIPLKDLPGASRLTPESGRGKLAHIVPGKDYLFLVNIAQESPRFPQGEVKAIWTMDRKTGKALLTYRHK
ncbi:MAG: hypothetical protein AB7D57_07260 [Desulfovibrionaceae bacterium]